MFIHPVGRPFNGASFVFEISLGGRKLSPIVKKGSRLLSPAPRCSLPSAAKSTSLDALPTWFTTWWPRLISLSLSLLIQWDCSLNNIMYAWCTKSDLQLKDSLWVFYWLLPPVLSRRHTLAWIAPITSHRLTEWQYRDLRHLSRSMSPNFVCEGSDNKYFSLVSHRVSL